MDSEYDDVPESDPDYARPKPHWSSDPHRSSAYKTLRSTFRDSCRRIRNGDGSYGKPCAICRERIDYRLTAPHPRSFSLHHVLPVATHPELLLSLSNCRPTHLRCNQTEPRTHTRDDDDDLNDGLGQLSEDW